MKNFHIKHGQCDSIMFPQNIFFWRLSVIARPLPCWQQDSLLLICLGAYPKIYHRTICPAVLICKRSNKKIISNFTEGERLFHLLWQPSAFEGNFTMWYPSCILQKRSSSPFQVGQEENIPGHPTEMRAYWFILKIAMRFSITTSRNWLMNTFLTVNITPTAHVRDSL